MSDKKTVILEDEDNPDWIWANSTSFIAGRCDPVECDACHGTVTEVCNVCCHTVCEKCHDKYLPNAHS